MAEKTPYEKAIEHLSMAAQRCVQDGASPSEVTVAFLYSAAASAVAQHIESTQFQDLAAQVYKSAAAV